MWLPSPIHRADHHVSPPTLDLSKQLCWGEVLALGVDGLPHYPVPCHSRVSKAPYLALTVNTEGSTEDTEDGCVSAPGPQPPAT